MAVLGFAFAILVWAGWGWQRGVTFAILWSVLIVAVTSLLSSRREALQRPMAGERRARQLALFPTEIRLKKLFFGLATVAAMSLFFVWRHDSLKEPVSLAFLVTLVFAFALGMLGIGSKQFDRLHNQVGLALVSGLVLALAALVVNLAVEEALVSSSRDRREAETKLAINRQDQWIFRSEDLEGFDLSGMSFARASGETPFDFSYATMEGAVLTNADLSGAVLRDTRLTGATLCGSNLAGADLSRAIMNDARLEGANLSKARLIEAQLQNAVLDRADLSDADLRGADLRGARFAGFGGDAAVVSSDSDRTSGAVSAQSVGCESAGAGLTGAVIDGANLSGANLKGATIENLDDAIVDEATTCPSGEKAVAPERGDAYCGEAPPSEDPGHPPVEAGLAIKPTTPPGTPVGHIARTVEEGIPMEFTISRICRPPAEGPAAAESSADESSAEDPSAGSPAKPPCDEVPVDEVPVEEWPVSVGAVDGVVRSTEGLRADERYEVRVRVAPPGGVAAESAPGECVSDVASRRDPFVFCFTIAVEAEETIETSLEFLVAADAEPGIPVARIPDRRGGDDERGAPVLTAGADRFRIDQSGEGDGEPGEGDGERAATGWVLVVDGPLEANATYEVVVQSPPELDDPWTVRMVIRAFPRNDPPALTVPGEPISVPRTARVGDVVDVLVEASDPNPDDVLHFAIVATEYTSEGCDTATGFAPLGTGAQAFTIDASTGTIMVGPLLKARYGCHRLVIVARDDSTDVKSTTAVVQIEVPREYAARSSPPVKSGR